MKMLFESCMTYALRTFGDVEFDGDIHFKLSRGKVRSNYLKFEHKNYFLRYHTFVVKFCLEFPNVLFNVLHIEFKK